MRFFEQAKNLISQVFSVSNSEWKGYWALFFICVLWLVLWYGPKLYFDRPLEVSKVEQDKLDSLISLLNTETSQSNQQRLFLFDPNSLTLDSLIMLGLDESIANRIMNYREKGGTFRVKEDLKRIYGLPLATYLQLESYIALPDSTSFFSQPSLSRPFDVNLVSAEQLKSIKGVGDVLSKRIVKYRELLGGYVDIEQLGEVYGLEEPAVSTVEKSAFIAKDFRPRKIQINNASVADLMRHPYISNDLAKDIVKFRELNGAIGSETVLAGFKSLDKHNYKKLILYLDFR